MDRLSSCISGRMRLCLAVAAVALGSTGCAYFQPKPIAAQPQAEQVQVYESMPPNRRSYRIVKRLWIEPWTSAIAVPRYASVEQGAADLRNRAVVLGGDAVVNFGCYHTRVDPGSNYYCNGSVIKYVQ